MFGSSDTWKRLKGESTRALRVHLGHVPQIEADPREDRRIWRIAIAAGIALHAALLLVTLPDIGAEPEHITPQRSVYVVQPVRFQPPKAQAAPVIPEQRERRRVIPIPDPTPDEPEPIRFEEPPVLADLDLDAIDLGAVIPEGPPATFGGPGVYRVGGEIVPPEKVYYPSPHYTEEARLGRIQGVVILEAVIDDTGSVRQARVLKGLPLGLSESALETIRQWRFRPATRHGEPVPVFFNLTVAFSLQ